MKQHKLPPIRCPFCGSLCDGATNAQVGQSNPPDSGDITMCIVCSGVCVYTDDLTLRKMNAGDYATLPDALKNILSGMVCHIDDLRSAFVPS